ncbi:penicillin-binding protein activator [Dongia deserti]|uniref:penicillin-binding protein activator n=1 Tax=Dongia deserti TaxID=2268030 RepID=UPI000E647A9B|nr:penicillin-binding protein activator [Dongia deserti]
MYQAVFGDVAQQAKRWVGALILGFAAGCAPSVPPPQAPDQPTPTQPQYETLPYEQTETGTKIGLLLPLSGQQAALGRTLLQAAEMGLFEVGDDRFTLMVEDTATAAGPDSAARKLLAQGANILLGPVFAADARKVAPVTQGAQIPVLAFTNDQSAAQPGLYVMGVTPQDQVERVVQYAASQGSRRFAILAPTSPYGSIVNQAFRNAVQRSNAVIAGMELYDPNSPDYTGIIEQLSTTYQRQPFDALMLPEGGAKLRQLAPLLPAFQIGPQNLRILGTALWANDPALAQETGLTGGWYATTDPGKWQQFADRYRGIYGAVPDQRAGLVYDAITLIVALGKSSTPDYSEAALTNPSGFSGVTGVFRLNQDGTVDRQLAVIEIVPGGGVVREAAPPTFAAAIN